MACRTELRFRLDLIRGMHRRDGGRKADPHSENHRKEAGEHDDVPPCTAMIAVSKQSLSLHLRGQSVAGCRIYRQRIIGESSPNTAIRVFMRRTLCEPS